MRAAWPRHRVWTTTAIVVVLLASVSAGCSNDDDVASTPATGAPAARACTADKWVTSWSAAPSDATTPLDATFGTLPERFQDRTVRNVVTPHLASPAEARLRLTNRFNPEPVTFAAVTIGASEPDGGVRSPRPVRFDGRTSVTAAPGEDLVSDPISLTFAAFEPVAVSLYLASTPGQLTKHWNANATTFLTPAGGGDETAATSGAPFTEQVHSWLGILALDVRAAPPARAVVAFGDSLTDGWVTASADASDLDLTVADEDLRYPDQLQRRLDRAGIPIAVLNAGLSANQLLAGSGFAGPAGVDRFAADVTGLAGVRGVVVFEGINDIGLAQSSAAEVIDGLRQLVAQAKAADLAVWLATITPASDSQLHGVAAAPASETDRQTVNEWIRTNPDVAGFFDFDAAVRDPANPAVLARQYASSDRLHLNPAGYERLAEAVDLDALADATC